MESDGPYVRLYSRTVSSITVEFAGGVLVHLSPATEQMLRDTESGQVPTNVVRQWLAGIRKYPAYEFSSGGSDILRIPMDDFQVKLGFAPPHSLRDAPFADRLDAAKAWLAAKFPEAG